MMTRQYNISLKDQYGNLYNGQVMMSYDISFPAENDEKLTNYLSITIQTDDSCTIQFNKTGFENDHSGGAYPALSFIVTGTDSISEISGQETFQVKYYI